MDPFEIRWGLCHRCQSEICEAAYGSRLRKNINVNTMRPETVARLKRENEKNSRLASAEYDRLTKEAETLCAVVADYFDDFGGGNIEFLLCRRHLVEAIACIKAVPEETMARILTPEEVDELRPANEPKHFMANTTTTSLIATIDALVAALRAANDLAAAATMENYSLPYWREYSQAREQVAAWLEWRE